MCSSDLGWERSNWKGRHMQMSLLDIDIPVICAVNGPALKHGDLIFLCDIILAAEHTTFQDSHLYCDTVPGDGAHVIYPMVMGINRARYFLLTSEVINAKQALEMGMINEILPKDKLMARAWELAELLAKANVERGAATVKSVCTTCHNVEKGAAPKPSGPNLPGVVGRVMGSTEFAYSDDLKNKKQPWTYESLDAFLNNPKSMGSGVKMTYSEKNPQKRAEIIAYLRSITDNAPPLPTP